MKRWLIRKIKKRFKLYTVEDVMWAFDNCGNAQDRDGLRWKLRNFLNDIHSEG